MSATLIVATAVVIASCIGFVVVGTVYKWDIASPGYGRWTRRIGVIAVIGMAGATAWARVEQPLLAVGIVLLGVALAAAFAVVHRRLEEKVRQALS